MIYFLYGEDTYRSREELRKMIEEYKKTCLVSRQANSDWFDFIRVDVAEDEIDFFERVRQSIDTVSMFNNQKLIIIENIFLADKDIQKNILEFLKQRNLDEDKNTTVIFWDEKADSKNGLFKFFKTKSKLQEFNSLRGVQLKNWIKKYINDQGGKIENQTLDKLIEYIGSDLWRMVNEINKLLSYDKTIKLENIELLIKPDFNLNIFNMVDSLAQKNKTKTLKLFNQHLEKGEDEFYLLSMFIYQIRNLIKVKSGGGSDMHPFVIRKTEQQARNFDWDDLKKIYRQLLTIDFDIKMGKIGPKIALELWVSKL